MDEFATVPVNPTRSASSAAPPTKLSPRKRPLSSMSPTIVLKDGIPVTVIGTPGGSRIFNAVYQVLSDIYDYGKDVEQAVKNPRGP